MNRKPIMAGNWKMYKTAREAVQFLEALAPLMAKLPQADLPEVVICPPFTALPAMADFLARHPMPLALGAQNMEEHDEGAYTGEISPLMLQEFGVRYVIIGHSERRQYFHESDEMISRKIRAALNHKMTPIFCVGESLDQREAEVTDIWIRIQVEEALEPFTLEERKQIVVAYEPIWAIGTGKVCDPDEANRVNGFIREVTRVPEIRVLYGGSVKPDNVVKLMGQTEIDGGLVGGASLEAESFFKLVEAAVPVKA